MTEFLVRPDAQLLSTIHEVRALDELMAQNGLHLSDGEVAALVEARFETLRETGRVEFGGGVLGKLIEAFCDSCYAPRDEWMDLLGELQEMFYFMKRESDEAFSDDELIEMMRGYYDGVCQGSMEMLSGTTLSTLCRAARGGYA